LAGLEEGGGALSFFGACKNNTENQLERWILKNWEREWNLENEFGDTDHDLGCGEGMGLTQRRELVSVEANQKP
jgi:hypothetical protein